jgi:hypothetical protein
VIRRQQKITDSFDLLLQGLARAYADKHELLLQPKYALAPGTHYHIAGRVVARKDFDHKELKALVTRYFDKGPLDYHAPELTISSSEAGRVLRVGSYDIGELPSNPTLAAQFTVELLRRHPILGERFLRPRLDAIEKAIAEQLDSERDKPDPPAEGRSERPAYAWMFTKIFLDYAAENDFGVVQELLPDGDVSHRLLPGGRIKSTTRSHGDLNAYELRKVVGAITIHAAANVKTITFVPGLVYRYAEKTKQDVSPLHKIVTKPGERAALEAGKYVYRLEFADATLSDYRPIRIPADLDEDDPRTLRIPSDPDEKGRPGTKPDEKRR